MTPETGRPESFQILDDTNFFSSNKPLHVDAKDMTNVS